MQLSVIDVSEHQGNIDWEKVKNAGVVGAMTVSYTHLMMLYIFLVTRLVGIKVLLDMYGNNLFAGALFYCQASVFP